MVKPLRCFDLSNLTNVGMAQCLRQEKKSYYNNFNITDINILYESEVLLW